MRRVVCALLCLALLIAALPVGALAEGYAHTRLSPDEAGFIPADDGVELEYAVYGRADAQAVLLLAPNGSDMHFYDTYLVPELAKTYRVVTFSTRGVGRTAHGEGKLTFDRDADDCVCVLDALGIDRAYVFGFSDGGNLALVLAVNHPERVAKLIPMSANIRQRGLKLRYQIAFTAQWLGLCVKCWFVRTDEARNYRDVIGKMVGQPKLRFSDLEGIRVPTLNIYGEHDLFWKCHSRGITESIPGCRELVVPDGGHSDCFTQTDTVLLPAILSFFAE